MSDGSQPNPFLSGNFAPMLSEDTFVDLPIEGEVPKTLAGTLYRNGPNPHSRRGMPITTGLPATG
jgi:carotenoid cleavage dioxygenase-like enzyme